MTIIVKKWKTANRTIDITAKMLAEDVLHNIAEFDSGNTVINSKEYVLEKLDELRNAIEENFLSSQEIGEKFADELEEKSKALYPNGYVKPEEIMVDRRANLTFEERLKDNQARLEDYKNKNPETKERMEKVEKEIDDRHSKEIKNTISMVSKLNDLEKEGE